MLLARYTKWNRTCVAFWLRFGLHTFLNTGDFFDGTYQDYILGTRTPQNYRNPFLARAMVNIKMIDTQGLGVHNLYLGQKNRFLPRPAPGARRPGPVPGGQRRCGLRGAGSGRIPGDASTAVLIGPDHRHRPKYSDGRQSDLQKINR